MSKEEYSVLLKAYVTTALWSSEDNNTPLDEDYNINDIDKKTLSEMEKDILSFKKEYAHLLTKEELESDEDFSTFAHNFWLTRNHHGAGFWDGDYANGETLSSACDKYGVYDLYIGDDKKIYK